ncbi:MAG: hypothetical protein GY913_13415 [Proteobacteria bacterium]|nr:hypothetical protein [Pseudomonadota bacterium]MCP4917906.1 hypothetical protein [Pseudomonadota bacterium]
MAVHVQRGDNEHRLIARLAALLFLSGACALCYEVLWMRRFALLFGGGGVAVTLTLATLFGGLGVGGLVGPRLPGRPTRIYAGLEAFAGCWALAFPVLLGWVTPLYVEHASLGVQALLVLVLAGPPAVALGATLPVLARSVPDRGVLAGLYAANTTGAVLGALAVPGLLLPVFGVTWSERTVAIVGLCVAAIAMSLTVTSSARRAGGAPARSHAVWAVAVAGLVAMALEVAWTRLASVLLGPSIHAFAWVLAVFLAGIALGAAWGRKRGTLSGALAALGLLALLGTFTYAQAPLLLAMLYDLTGADGVWMAEVALAIVTMAGAPIASGVVFARALDEAGGDGARTVGTLYGANTLAGVVGSAATGLLVLPWLGVQGVVTLGALLCLLAATALSRRPWFLAIGLVFLAPAWDGKLYAVGIYNRVSDLGDRSPEAVRAFAESGWELLSYADGRTAAVAVGRSTKTGNVWLSINGKVDASTGDDMPTQVLSGQIPMRMHPDPRRALVVGLASGVTAGAVLDDGVGELVLVELEPEVVAASHYFDHVNGRPLDDPRTQLVADDARAVLSRPGEPFDVIISEPSNPWITGVSNLFTLEYWRLGRARLSDGGVFCQWIQLYGLATRDFQSIVATFTDVFPDTWLFEPLEGGDVLLIGVVGSPRLDHLPLEPVLGPAGVARLAEGGELNTDDHPGVELRAPRAIHLATVDANRALIEAAR